MADLNYTSATDIKLLPIRGVAFYSVGEWLRITQLEAESSWRFDPILRDTDRGTKVILAFRFNATLYVPQNYYVSNNLLTRLELYRTQSVDTQIMLGTSKAIGMGALVSTLPAIVNATAGTWMDLHTNCSVTYRIESVQYRPRLIISVDGIYNNPKEYLTNYPIFNTPL